MFEPKDDVPDFKSVLEVSLIPVFILPADDWPAFDSVVIALVCEVTDLDVLELSDFGGATTVGWPVASCLVMLLLVFGSVFGLLIMGASDWTLCEDFELSADDVSLVTFWVSLLSFLSGTISIDFLWLFRSMPFFFAELMMPPVGRAAVLSDLTSPESFIVLIDTLPAFSSCLLAASVLTSSLLVWSVKVFLVSGLIFSFVGLD